MYSPRDQYIPMSQNSTPPAFLHHPPHYNMHQAAAGHHHHSGMVMSPSPSPSSSPYFLDLSPRDIGGGGHQSPPSTISPRHSVSLHDWPYPRPPSDGFKWTNGKPNVQQPFQQQHHHNQHYFQGSSAAPLPPPPNCNISISPPPSPPNSYIQPSASTSPSSLRSMILNNYKHQQQHPASATNHHHNQQQQQQQQQHQHYSHEMEIPSNSTHQSSLLYSSSPVSSSSPIATSSTTSISNAEKKLMSRVIVPLLNLKQSRPQEAPTVSPKSPCLVPDETMMFHNNSSRGSPGQSPPGSPGDFGSFLIANNNNGRVRSNSTSSSTASTPRGAQDHLLLLNSTSNLTLSSAPNTPRNTSSTTTSTFTTTTTTTNNNQNQEDTNNNNNNNQSTDYLKKAEEQWKKLEYFSNDFNHFVFEIIKNKEFHQLSALNSKLGEITSTVQEIEITNNIFKTLPPQTRARKKRATKAEKLKKSSGGVLGVKRTYVTTPKSKGNYCVFCGTMETPEWRKGPGGHKTLCNACGLHYAKNLKREGANKSKTNNDNIATPSNTTNKGDSNSSASSSTSNSPTSSSMNVASLLASTNSDD
ncbi:putative GATA-binding transcription factor [Cavenderia fasciculata]|uniref:GATA-binding transcription factor n=1 Tax=Cavenderia fasciculata TaxID=261658 RepID=F4Q0Y4_CACFS|nr:putative GATA-binding transcription factor [Cavenderia fasciculata]EGG18485.1 putative GATA-binding transcription factor [Cavenderia fasciculata]|eukprot:XP_004366389.1 putative GATA-binding transcription factor [Cavenderia fasciculata]